MYSEPCVRRRVGEKVLIYTVTLNPSLDYVVHVNSLSVGAINRVKREEMYPGGKGINVSLVLANLGISSQMLGFIAGFTGKEIARLAKHENCSSDFVELPTGFSRINVKISGQDMETALNGLGPEVRETDLDALFAKIMRLHEDDTLVLAGSVPGTIRDDIYERIMAEVEPKGVRVVVDATKDLLLNVLKYHPFLVKPNEEELEELFNVSIQSREDVITYGTKLRQMGAKNVLVSRGGDGAILLGEDGQTYMSDSPKGTLVNSVGAGDSMVAGFLAGYGTEGNLREALRLGIACGSASAFHEWLGTKEQIYAVLETI